MRAALLLCLAIFPGAVLAQQSWILSSLDGRSVAGERFDVVVVAPGDELPPDEISVRVRAGSTDVVLHLQASGAADGARRGYTGTMPQLAPGAVNLTLDGKESNSLVLLLATRDAVQALTSPVPGAPEPPLSANEPIYFAVGTRDDVTARFQLSFKYRLFDYGSGFGSERPWLAGFYFAYTQTSLWDLSSESKAFRDTSYRPSLFWQWQRTDGQTWIDGARLGAEHESNGRDGVDSRSVNSIYVRPEWRWAMGGGTLEFTPRINAYFDNGENPDIVSYRGPVDWRLRYDTGDNWIATGVARFGTGGHGSVQLEAARRTRDLKFGPVSGYLFVQYFNGYGETILDYNVKRAAQVRLGFAIVP